MLPGKKKFDFARKRGGRQFDIATSQARAIEERQPRTSEISAARIRRGLNSRSFTRVDIFYHYPAARGSRGIN